MGGKEELQLILGRLIYNEGLPKTVKIVNEIIEDESIKVSVIQHKDGYAHKIYKSRFASIEIFESRCKWIADTIQRTNLRHRERGYIMFMYMKFGEEGEKRLREILGRQKNYNEKITNTQIEYYKKRGKFFGVSCKKLIEDGLCKYGGCPNARSY